MKVKTKEIEVYNSVRVAFKETKKEKLNKPSLGIFNKNKTSPCKLLREFRIGNVDDYKVGDRVLIDQFKKDGYIDITGISKGKGFQGVVKRYNFKGGPKTRGQGNKWRSAGSIGAGTDPGRIWKGRRMPGRMGNITKTIQNLRIVHINKDNNLLLIKGSIPGPRSVIIKIRHAVKKKNDAL